MQPQGMDQIQISGGGDRGCLGFLDPTFVLELHMKYVLYIE